MKDNLDEIVATMDCLPGKTAMTTVADGDICLIARDEGLIIKGDVIPWRSATAVAEEIMRMVGEWA